MQFVPWQTGAQICGLSVYDSERDNWAAKFDGAENTDIEPVKGGLSDSFKRAACVWGIGRHLYELGGIWFEKEQRGKSSVIKDNQRTKLEAKYNSAVVQMSCAAAPVKTTAPVTPAEQKTPLVLPTTNNQQPPVTFMRTSRTPLNSIM